jgi:Ca-activated chloride channel family protein
LTVAGLSILVLSLARPQSVIGVPRLEGIVLLAFDVSGSMAATDLAPTRMEAAKAAARAFVDRQPEGVVIGVVAFSDSGFSVQTPSSDPGTVLAAIDRLQPQKGTSLGRGILDSLQAIAVAEEDEAVGYYTNRSPTPTIAPTPLPPGSHSSAVIVLLTDGENNEQPDPIQAAKAAADRGVRIYPIGIGSPAGANLKIDGFTVHSQLDEATLKEVAQLTGGSYYAAQSTDELQRIYDELDPRLTFKSAPTEVTAILTGFGLILLVIGGLASLAWTGRIP